MESVKKRFVLQTRETCDPGAKIKVIGIGGGGSNAVDYMADELLEEVECYVANTDSQALKRAITENKLQFGHATTQGRGAGFNPQRGREAALEDRQKLMEYLGNADMVFITAGLGGGTGTGAAPVFAQAFKEHNPESLVVAVVTMPFSFEGERRMEYAEFGVRELRKTVDSIITIANDKILSGDIPLFNAYSIANEVLLNAVRGISDVIVRPGFVNVDFADVKTIMSEDGLAMMAHGRAGGKNRAQKVAEVVLSNPLLEGIDLADAKGLLVNITASSNISTGEYRNIGELIRNAAPNAESIVSGLVFDEDIGDELRVTIVASGLTVPEDALVEQSSPFTLHESEMSNSTVDDRFEAPIEQHTEEFEFAPGNGEEQSETRFTAHPFVDEIEEFEHDDGYANQEPVHVPSILRNRGNFKPYRLNGAADRNAV